MFVYPVNREKLLFSEFNSFFNLFRETWVAIILTMNLMKRIIVKK